MASDRYAWAIETAGRVRAGDFEHIDRDTLAEELEQMSRADRRELRRFVERIIEHMLKIRYIGGPACPHWKVEILNFTDEVEYALEESPSLKAYLQPELLQDLYVKVLRRMRREYQPFATAPDRLLPPFLDELNQHLGL